MHVEVDEGVLGTCRHRRGALLEARRAGMQHRPRPVAWRRSWGKDASLRDRRRHGGRAHRQSDGPADGRRPRPTMPSAGCPRTTVVHRRPTVAARAGRRASVERVFDAPSAAAAGPPAARCARPTCGDGAASARHRPGRHRRRADRPAPCPGGPQERCRGRAGPDRRRLRRLAARRAGGRRRAGSAPRRRRRRAGRAGPRESPAPRRSAPRTRQGARARDAAHPARHGARRGLGVASHPDRRETACLERDQRAAHRRRALRRPGRLEGLGDKRLVAEIRRLAYSSTRARSSTRASARRERAPRHDPTRTRHDVLPHGAAPGRRGRRGVRRADPCRGQRSRCRRHAGQGQVMADTLVERVDRPGGGATPCPSRSA